MAGPSDKLAALAGLTPRAIRYYLERELIPRPAFRGTATRYGRPVLLRLLAISRMRTEDLGLVDIKTKLAAMSAPGLEAFAVADLPEGPASVALGIPPKVKDVASPLTGEAWHRIAILPGLELLVRADASPLVRGLAQQFHDHCVGTAKAT